MRRTINDGCSSSREMPPALIAVTLAALLLLCIMLLTSLATGCAHTKAGLAREQVAYQTTTNVVTQLHQLIPYTPVPTNYLGEAILAAVTAGLGAWNVSQHRRLKDLETKSNGKTPALP